MTEKTTTDATADTAPDAAADATADTAPDAAADATADATADAAAEMDAWTMTTSCLVGLHKALAKAEEEYAAAVKAGKGKSFAPGVSAAAHLRNTLSDAIEDIEPELHQLARANNLPMPTVREEVKS